MNPENNQIQPTHAQASGPHSSPTRPPHPNRKLSAEVIAPMLQERAHEVLQELQSAVCAPKTGAFMVVQAPQAGQIFGQSIESRGPQDTSDKLSLLQSIEHARGELLRAEATGSNEDQLAVWATVIAPLIDNAIKELKQKELGSLDFMGKFRDGFLGSLEITDDTQKDDSSTSSDASDALKSFTDRFSTLSRMIGRRERTRLSTMRYDPYAQLPECRLNEVALDLKLQNIGIVMDEREPVASVPEDDLKLVVSFYAKRAQDWLKELQVQIFNELIDPFNALSIQDTEAFSAHCNSIGNQEEITCAILGCNEIQLVASIPATTTIDIRRSQHRIEELLAPSSLFRSALGISHRIEFVRADDTILVKFRIIIPTDNSRYEPKNFSARKQDLKRLEKPALLESSGPFLEISHDVISPEALEEDPTESAPHWFYRQLKT